MYKALEYTFKRKVISGRRVTVPKIVLDQLDLSVGDTVSVTFRKVNKDLRGIVLS